MTFLNAWVLVGLLPLYLLYRNQDAAKKTKQMHQLYLALAFILLTLSRPAIKGGIVDQSFDSQDYIIAIDASYSMQADDIKPTRYTAAIKAIKQFVALHPKDRFTLFAFTSNALLISPPTTDTRISIQALDALNPNYILTKSTSLYHLFETVAKVSFKQKKLIIFSDGGDEHDLARVLHIAKTHTIVVYAVAAATQRGAALKKDGSYLKNSASALVVSKINPILKPLAQKSGGRYFELTSAGVVDALSDAIGEAKASKPETIKVQSYDELFYVPLFIALLLFFLAVTKFHQMILLLMPLMFIPAKVDASALDAYYLSKAYQSYKHSHYKKAAQWFDKTTPSVQSYYNIATAWYKAGAYKKALEYYMQIKTPDPMIKQKIYYNMGNCAVKLRRYDKAERFYMNALALGKDPDALYNLNLLRRLHLKTQRDVTKMMPSKAKQSKQPKRGNTKRDEEKSGGSKKSSNPNSAQSTSGQGESKQQKKAAAKRASAQPGKYKMGYKAYERINKGYADEKEPW